MKKQSQMEIENKRIGDLRQIMRNTRPDSPMYQDAHAEMKAILSAKPSCTSGVAWTVSK